ncbi:MAG: glycosyltransferase [Bacteroidales bacterium]|nr:glycosyltransferase [Bacteroidales bacterium]
MKQLVLFSSHFPFGSGETFLEPEIPCLCRAFDRITICTEHHNDETTARPLPDKCQVVRYRTDSSAADWLRLPWLALSFCRSCCKALQAERKAIKDAGIRFRIRHLQRLLHDLAKGLQTARFIRRHFKAEDTLFYTYWLKAPALGLALLHARNDAWCGVSRAHGHDVYAEVHQPAYIPFQRFKVMQLNGVHCVSAYGRDYLCRRMPDLSDRVHVSRLGTPAPESLPDGCPGEVRPLHIVTCSNLPASDVKRIPLLIAALHHVRLPLVWTHIGSGPRLAACQAGAEALQQQNPQITVEFTGQMTNRDIHRYYASHFVHAVLNVSRSEGIPVALMEAVSYGIPVLATDAGGNREVCNNTTGRLIPVEQTPESLAEALTAFLTGEADRFDREAIRQYWADRFSADRNFRVWAELLQRLATR